MKIFAITSCLLISAVVCADDFASWSSTFRSQRTKMPEFQCSVQEHMRVGSPDAPISKPRERVVSWGTDNADRQVDASYKDGKMSVTCLNFAGTSKKGPRDDFKYVIADGKGYATVSRGMQGTIDRAQDLKIFWSPDCFFGYFMRNGQPYDSVIPQNASVASAGDLTTVDWSLGDDTMEIKCSATHEGQVQYWALKSGETIKVSGEVARWDRVGQFTLPSEVVTRWYDGGTEIKTLTSDIAYSNSKVDAAAFKTGWQENAFVRDNIKHAIYKLKNGRLVEESALTKGFNQTYGGVAPLFVASLAVLVLGGTGWMAKRFRKRS